MLLGWEGDTARLLLSESDGGEVQVTREVLTQDYSGRVFFAQPQHKFRRHQRHADPPRTFVVQRHPQTLPLAVRRRYRCEPGDQPDRPGCAVVCHERVRPRGRRTRPPPPCGCWRIGICGAYLFDLLLKSMRSLCLDLAGKKTDLIISATLFERIVGMSMKNAPGARRQLRLQHPRVSGDARLPHLPDPCQPDRFALYPDHPRRDRAAGGPLGVDSHRRLPTRPGHRPLPAKTAHGNT